MTAEQANLVVTGNHTIITTEMSPEQQAEQRPLYTDNIHPQ
jgi:hypothetical protein